jgi:hypothetical protein
MAGVQGGLHTAPSGVSDAGVVAKMSELDMMDMDDLLGLNEPLVRESTDPFKASQLPRASSRAPLFVAAACVKLCASVLPS